MQSDQNVLNTVIGKFPEKVNTLTKLFDRDENFREICEDYYLCKEAINKIIITDTRKRKILKEYKHALEELEMEMLVYMNSGVTIHNK